MDEKISIQPEWVRELASGLYRCASDLAEISRETASVRLAPAVAGEERLGSRLKKVADDTDRAAESLRRFAAFLEESAAAYEQAEQRLLSQADSLEIRFQTDGAGSGAELYFED